MKSADHLPADFPQATPAGADSAPDELADEPLAAPDAPASALPEPCAGLDSSLVLGFDEPPDALLVVAEPFLKSVTYQPEPLS